MPKVKVIISPWSKVTQISKLNIVFLKNCLVMCNKIYVKAYGIAGMRMYTNILGAMTKMTDMP